MDAFLQTIKPQIFSFVSFVAIHKYDLSDLANIKTNEEYDLCIQFPDDTPDGVDLRYYTGLSFAECEKKYLADVELYIDLKSEKQEKIRSMCEDQKDDSEIEDTIQ